MLPYRFAMGQFKELSADDLTFLAQLGMDGITINRPDFADRSWKALLGQHYPYGPTNFTDDARWEFPDLLNLRLRVESFGLKLEAIENTPLRFVDKILLGKDGREEQMANYLETLRNVGRAGIKVLGYHWMPSLVWRTSTHQRIRGGATVPAYDDDIARLAPPTFDRTMTAEERWDHYSWFIERALPVAEEAGVTLALHPDDPPAPMLGGAARIMSSIEGLERALAIGDSPNHKLTYCVGTMGEIDPAVAIAGVETFLPRGKIAYLHVRNVTGQMPAFREGFIDEGDIDILRVLQLLTGHRFDGFIIDDHVPGVAGDTVWGHRSRAYSTGYLKGLGAAIERLAAQ